jgi:hypothetical protein
VYPLTLPKLMVYVPTGITRICGAIPHDSPLTKISPATGVVEIVSVPDSVSLDSNPKEYDDVKTMNVIVIIRRNAIFHFVAELLINTFFIVRNNK